VREEELLACVSVVDLRRASAGRRIVGWLRSPWFVFGRGSFGAGRCAKKSSLTCVSVVDLRRGSAGLRIVGWRRRGSVLGRAFDLSLRGAGRRRSTEYASYLSVLASSSAMTVPRFSADSPSGAGFLLTELDEFMVRPFSPPRYRDLRTCWW